VSLDLQTRTAGHVAVVTCRGRLIQTEAASLERALDELLPLQPNIVLHLGDITFVDSSGLGLLVRYLARARHAGGGLKLCAVSPKVAEALRVTRMASSFGVYADEEAAIAAFHRSGGDRAPDRIGETDVLVVDPSADVQAYLRELFRQAGFGVATATNLPDALALFRAGRPRVVVMGRELREVRSTGAGSAFNQLAESVGVVELPADYSTHEAGAAGQMLLDNVRTLLARK
jgi:anti-anti-sigma factor